MRSRRSANAEAVAHTTRCLDLLSAVPDALERARLELAIRMLLGPALIATKGYGALEVQQTYARARELCDRVEDRTRMFPVLRGLWNSYLFRAEMPKARERAAELLSLARDSDDTALVVEAHRVMSTVSFFIGDFSASRSHAEQGMALYDPDRHRPLAFVFGADPGVICGLYGALSLWMLGYPQQAEAGMDRATAGARVVAHGHTEAFALTYQSFHHVCRREVHAARECAQAAIAVASKLGIRQWAAWSAVLHGWALAMEGEAEDGSRQLRDSLEDWRSMGNEAFVVPLFRGLLAEALAFGGQVGEALAAVRDALTVTHDTEQRFWEAELHRVQGELLLAASPDDPANAEACFHQALGVARQQHARFWELRAATSLARLWQGQGRTDDARGLLMPVYDWFTEGFDTPDLRDAKAVLDELTPAASARAAR